MLREERELAVGSGQWAVGCGEWGADFLGLMMRFFGGGCNMDNV